RVPPAQKPTAATGDTAMGKKVEPIHGPFDPGGQPETRSGNPLELGFFAWNLSGGMTASKAVLSDPARLRDFWHWDTALYLNQTAERIGYEYQVPFGRWRGWGGATGYNEESLDFLTAAACLAPVTSRLGLFSPAHATYKFPPVHTAKTGAPTDFVPKGRGGLNAAPGSTNRRENALFGQEAQDHDQSYELADEFVTLMKWLWASDEPIDFEGKYFQSYDAVLRPRPLRQPRPVLMNAGNSASGIDFATRQCDWVFLTGRTLDESRLLVNQVLERAARYGRTVRPATMVYVIMAETDQRAQEVVDWVEAEVDKEAINNFLFGRTRDPGSS